MVNYFNPLAMYGPGSGKAAAGGAYGGGGGGGGWYGWGQAQQFPTGADEAAAAAAAAGWHHPHAFQPPHDWSTPSPEFPPPGAEHAPPHGPLAPPAHHFPKREPTERDGPLPSPPGTASSELSSPGAGAGAGSSPAHPAHHRPPMPRSPYEWMKKPNYQSQPNPAAFESTLLSEFSQPEQGGKTRTKDKYRVVYSDHQRLELEKEFHYSRYITIRRKAELAANLGLSERQVKIWFQNRRAKERKQVKKREEVVLKDKSDHTSLQQIHHAHATVLHHQQMMSGMMHHHHHAYHQGVIPPEQLVGGVSGVPLL